MAKSNSQLAVLTEYKIAEVSTEELADVMQQNLAGEDVGAMNLPRLKVPTGGGLKFQVPSLEGPVDMKEVEGVLLHSKISRAYWPGSYAGGGTPPQCMSPDGLIGNGDPGGKCAMCPHNKWGSKDGARGKACKEMRMLFILRPDLALPMVLVVPPSSINSVKEYTVNLAGNLIPMDGALTTFSLEKASNKDGIDYSKIVPKFKQKLDPEARATIKAYKQSLGGILDTYEVDYEEAAGD